jgi:hypothetical protein
MVSTVQSINLNAWTLVEWHWESAPNQMTVRLATDPAKPTSYEEIRAGMDVVDKMDQAWYGHTTPLGTAVDYYFDNLAAGASDWPFSGRPRPLYWTRAKARRGRRFTTLAK